MSYGNYGRYSTRECKAFNMGRAYGAAKAGRNIKGFSDRDKQSFRAGYKVGSGKNKK